MPVSGEEMIEEVDRSPILLAKTSSLLPSEVSLFAGLSSMIYLGGRYMTFTASLDSEDELSILTGESTPGAVEAFPDAGSYSPRMAFRELRRHEEVSQPSSISVFTPAKLFEVIHIFLVFLFSESSSGREVGLTKCRCNT